jgi:MOSC domain-containing protein YiiM
MAAKEQDGTLGWVEQIHVTGRERAPMRRVERVRAVAGRGLEGDRYLLGTGRYSGRAYADEGRHVTLIEMEVLEALANRTGIELSAAESRRNIATRSVRLNDLVDERFYVGDVLCEGVRLCEPCLYLVEVTHKPVLGPLIRRGGMRAHILTDGVIEPGDPLRLASVTGEPEGR